MIKVVVLLLCVIINYIKSKDGGSELEIYKKIISKGNDYLIFMYNDINDFLKKFENKSSEDIVKNIEEKDRIASTESSNSKAAINDNGVNQINLKKCVTEFNFKEFYDIFIERNPKNYDNHTLSDNFSNKTEENINDQTFYDNFHEINIQKEDNNYTCIDANLGIDTKKKLYINILNLLKHQVQLKYALNKEENIHGKMHMYFFKIFNNLLIEDYNSTKKKFETALKEFDNDYIRKITTNQLDINELFEKMGNLAFKLLELKNKVKKYKASLITKIATLSWRINPFECIKNVVEQEILIRIQLTYIYLLRTTDINKNGIIYILEHKIIPYYCNKKIYVFQYKYHVCNKLHAVDLKFITILNDISPKFLSCYSEPKALDAIGFTGDTNENGSSYFNIMDEKILNTFENDFAKMKKKVEDDQSDYFKPFKHYLANSDILICVLLSKNQTSDFLINN